MKYKSKIQINFRVIKCGKLAAMIFALSKLVSGILLPFTAYEFQKLIDEIILSFQAKNDERTFVVPLLLIAGIYCFQAIEEPVEQYCKFLLTQKLNYWFDTGVINKLAKIKYSCFENSDDLDLINRIDGTAGEEAVTLFDSSLNLASGIIKIVGTFGLLLLYDFHIAMVVVIVAIPVMIVSSKYGKLIHDWYEKNSKKRRQLNYLSSLFVNRSAACEIKEYNHYDYLKEEWKGHFEDLRKKDFKLQIKAWKKVLVSSILLNIFEYATYLIMLLPTAGGSITIGAFVGLSKAISCIEGLILWEFSSLVVFFSRSTKYWNDYNRFFDLPEIQIDVQLSHYIPSVNCSQGMDVYVEFRNVFFRYDNMDTDVLSDVSFIIGPHQLCGLVGVNGAGKSTLVKLMLGLYKPTSGDILINNQNTKFMSFNEQVGYFGMTYQDFERFNISIYDNVVMNLKKSGRIDIEQKVKNILDLLVFNYKKFPLEIRTVLGCSFENGVDISGGEWQKIAIARMVFANRACWIMDEPTASLDPMGEVELYKHIKTILSNKTSLLVTHRLGTTTLCDKIMVLDGGKIVETGTFEELIEEDGVYAKMYKEQKQWYSK